MAEGRSRAAWDHTAYVVATLANVHRDPKKRPRPYEPEDFHPLRRRARRTPPTAKVTVGELRAILGLKPRPRERRTPPETKG
jgi:hypothetical protein